MPELIAITPGRDWDTAKASTISSFDIYFFLSTISLSIMGSMASPPPMVKAPILKKVIKRSNSSAAFVFFILFSKNPDLYNSFDCIIGYENVAIKIQSAVHFPNSLPCSLTTFFHYDKIQLKCKQSGWVIHS